jgi:hypothetical protein
MNILRRHFLKSLMGGLLGLGAGAKISLGSEAKTSLVFDDIYHHAVVQLNELRPCSLGCDAILWGNVKLVLPFFYYQHKDLDTYLYRTVLAAGTNNHIAMCDAQAPKNTVSTRLLSLMTTCMKREDAIPLCERPLTDMYLSEDAKIDTPRFGINFHKVPKQQWKEVENFYIHELQSKFGSGKENLVIGIAGSNKRDFVHVQIDGKPDYHAIAVLRNKKVLLGMY